jgi:hypothetical protein
VAHGSNFLTVLKELTKYIYRAPRGKPTVLIFYLRNCAVISKKESGGQLSSKLKSLLYCSYPGYDTRTMLCWAWFSAVQCWPMLFWERYCLLLVLVFCAMLVLVWCLSYHTDCGTIQLRPGNGTSPIMVSYHARHGMMRLNAVGTVPYKTGALTKYCSMSPFLGLMWYHTILAMLCYKTWSP